MDYIEDYLQHYVENIGVTNSNKQILESINRQCKRNIALTDRQYALVKKLLAEKFDVDNVVNKLPLREIDRSKYVKIIPNNEIEPNTPYESYKSDWKWIKVRFPFSKKDIAKIDKICTKISTKNYVHSKGSHEHYFKLSGLNLDVVLEYFSNFDLSEEVIQYQKEITIIKNNKQNIIDSLPIPANDHLTDIQKIDRSLRYGSIIEKQPFTNNLLLDNILERNEPYFNVSPKQYNINNVVELINELDRYPLLILIDQSNAYEELTEFYNAIKYIVPDEKQSVLFRVDKNDNEDNVNTFIRNNNLNNWVDSNTKIVYINKNKLPKILLSSSFRPIACYSKRNTKNQVNVDLYVNFCCDLILTLDDIDWSYSYHRYVRGHRNDSM